MAGPSRSSDIASDGPSRYSSSAQEESARMTGPSYSSDFASDGPSVDRSTSPLTSPSPLVSPVAHRTRSRTVHLPPTRENSTSANPPLPPPSVSSELSFVAPLFPAAPLDDLDAPESPRASPVDDFLRAGPPAASDPLDPWSCLLQITDTAPVYIQPVSLPSSDAETNDLLDQLGRIHVASRPLSSLPLATSWHKNRKKRWQLAARRLAPVVRHSTSSYRTTRDSTLLLRTSLAIQALPSHILGDLKRVPTSFIFEEGSNLRQVQVHSIASPTSEDPSPPRPLFTRVTDLVYKDRFAKATKALTSYGAANRSRATADIMKRMHADYGQPLRPPAPPADGLTITPDLLAQEIRRRARTKDCSIDALGWSDDLVQLIASPKIPPEENLIDAIAEFFALLTSVTLHPSIALCWTTGSLTALNKISAAQQSLLPEPKLRPVNNGSLFLKRMFQTAIKTPSGTLATRCLTPIQLGLGVSAGPELAAHTARHKYNLGWAIATVDATNGFNNLKRQALFDAVARHWPEAISIFNNFYAVESPVFYSYEEDNQLIVRHLVSKEGTRMGCALGSVGYDLTVKSVYDKLAETFPDFMLRALTDDLIFMIPPPANGASWNDQLQRYLSFLKLFDTLARPLGLERNASKDQLLLPKSAFGTLLPDLQDRAKPTFDGIVVSGAPIGTDTFVLQHAQQRMDDLLPLFETIGDFTSFEPQIALKMAASSTNHLLDYYVRVTPPHLFSAVLAQFDRKMEDIRCACVAPFEGFRAPAVPGHRLQRFHVMACLPMKDYGGLGHIPLTRRAPIAHLASLCRFIGSFPSGHRSELLDNSVLSQDISHTLRSIHALLPSDFRDDCSSSHLLPANAEALISGSWYPGVVMATGIVPTHPHKNITDLIHRRILVNLLDQLKEDHENFLLSDADITHLRTQLLRSQITRALDAPLHMPHNRISRGNFINWLRYVFNLPPLLPAALPAHCFAQAGTILGVDYETLICPCSYDRIHQHLTATQEHVFACPAICKQTNQSCHNRLRDFLVHACRTHANLLTTREPSTASILFEDVTLANGKRLFNRKTAMDKRTTAQIQEQIRNVENSIENCAEHSALRKQLRQSVDAILSLDAPTTSIRDKRTGRRFDLLVDIPDEFLQIAVDVATCHTTASSKLRQNFVSMRNIAEATVTSYRNRTSNPKKGEVSWDIVERTKMKNNTYALLLALLAAQRTLGSKLPDVNLRIPVMSHAGELSPDFFLLFRELRRLHFKNFQPSDEGITRHQSATQFLKTLKSGVMTACADTVGAAILVGQNSHPFYVLRSSLASMRRGSIASTTTTSSSLSSFSTSSSFPSPSSIGFTRRVRSASTCSASSGCLVSSSSTAPLS